MLNFLIMSSRKRLGKNMTQIENQDDLRLIANIILVFAYT
ncbi:hypothetical protein LRU_02019 [Ligilactobacillus ruminis SPM0211]|uniref:Uncharacterized protein n=1 Tax=Ligilactobacillus ruminis SPM0211 TaxID=1040964 RepID=F7R2S0_9LACO|nr:hypothetical protein LRU_02019 [Ligilactobacillus ruminis SPM0211]